MLINLRPDTNFAIFISLQTTFTLMRSENFGLETSIIRSSFYDETKSLLLYGNYYQLVIFLAHICSLTKFFETGFFLFLVLVCSLSKVHSSDFVCFVVDETLLAFWDNCSV